MAGGASWISFAGHAQAGAQTNAQLTFALHHQLGADQHRTANCGVDRFSLPLCRDKYVGGDRLTSSLTPAGASLDEGHASHAIPSAVTKALALILSLLMLVQVLRPLGLPGLRRRADAWKLAVLGLAIIIAVAALRPD